MYLHSSAEVCVEIALPHTVRMNIDVHIGFTVLFIDLLKASEKRYPMMFLETVGTQIVQNQLVSPQDTVKCRPKGIMDSDSCILSIGLCVKLHARTFRLEPLRQYPPGHIAPEAKAVLLLLGNKGKIPADLPGIGTKFIQAAALCPAV